MGWTPAALAVQAAAAGADASRIALFTADPGATGANEVTGGSYAAVATTWTNEGDGDLIGSQVTINVPAVRITHWGIKTAAGVFRGGWPLPAAETFGAAGQYRFTPTITVANLA